jgi:hypothetical protein
MCCVASRESQVSEGEGQTSGAAHRRTPGRGDWATDVPTGSSWFSS